MKKSEEVTSMWISINSRGVSRALLPFAGAISWAGLPVFAGGRQVWIPDI